GGLHPLGERHRQERCGDGRRVPAEGQNAEPRRIHRRLSPGPALAAAADRYGIVDGTESFAAPAIGPPRSCSSTAMPVASVGSEDGGTENCIALLCHSPSGRYSRTMSNSCSLCPAFSPAPTAVAARGR